MTDYLLDTSILIFRLRNNPRVEQLLSQLDDGGDWYISGIVRTEILAGMRPQEEAATLDLLNALISLPIDNPTADRAGRLIYQYARQGVTLGIADAVIAATAPEHTLTLVTTNAKHFPMPELQLHLVKQSEL
ncbi:MAG: type II toxin-antitoxin system VapC family toxin [Anaerolineae bacterium]|nr:type II toxin-antitoxin system VapC family toxin [Anaerolineae bacterium]